MLTLVPAHNEVATVADVVQALLPAMGHVFVVDDGSTDGTGAAAAAAGASVLTTPSNLGKGGALAYALRRLPKDDVAFFDADLVGFGPEHPQRLVDAFAQGYDMVCGLHHHGGALPNALQLVMPLVTGERILRRWVIDRVPLDCWAGYAIETAFNDVVARGGGRTALILAEEPSIHRSKLAKVGSWEGLKGHFRMLQEIFRAENTLERTCGESCECSR